MDSIPPGSSVHEILQARILGWVAMPFSRGSSQPKDDTCISNVSCIGRQVPYNSAPPGSQQSELGLENIIQCISSTTEFDEAAMSLLWSVTVEVLLCGCQQARSYGRYQEKVTKMCTCLPGHQFPHALSTEVWFQTDSFWCSFMNLDKHMQLCDYHHSDIAIDIYQITSPLKKIPLCSFIVSAHGL